MTTQTETPARRAFYAYIATHDVPEDGEGLREMFEWAYREGARQVLHDSAQWSQTVHLQQRLLAAIGVLPDE